MTVIVVASTITTNSTGTAAMVSLTSAAVSEGAGAGAATAVTPLRAIPARGDSAVGIKANRAAAHGFGSEAASAPRRLGREDAGVAHQQDPRRRHQRRQPRQKFQLRPGYGG